MTSYPHSTAQTTCFYCGERSFTITCPLGKQHEMTQHNEGACPRWYDVGGCFEDEHCFVCPVTARDLIETLVGPIPF